MKTHSKIIIGVSSIIIFTVLFYKYSGLRVLERFSVDDNIISNFNNLGLPVSLFSSTKFPLVSDSEIQSKITELYGNSINEKTLVDPSKFIKGRIHKQTSGSNSGNTVYSFEATASVTGTSKNIIGFQPYILLMIAGDSNGDIYGFYTTVVFKNIQLKGNGNFEGTIIQENKDGNYFGSFPSEFYQQSVSDGNRYILIGPLYNIPNYNSPSDIPLNKRSFKVGYRLLSKTISTSVSVPQSAHLNNNTNNNNVDVMDVLKNLKVKESDDANVRSNGGIDLGTHSMADCMKISQWKRDDLGDTENAYFSYQPTSKNGETNDIDKDDNGKCYYIGLQNISGITANTGGAYIYPLPDKDFQCVDDNGDEMKCDQVLARRLIEEEEKKKMDEIDKINEQLFKLKIDKIRVDQANGIIDEATAMKKFYESKRDTLQTLNNEKRRELEAKNQEIEKTSNMQTRYLISFKRQKEQELERIRSQFKELNQLNADITRSTKLVSEENNRLLYIDSVHNLLIIVFIVLIVIGFLMLIYYNNKYSGAIMTFVNNTKNKIMGNSNVPPKYNNVMNFKPSAPPTNANDLGNLF